MLHSLIKIKQMPTLKMNTKSVPCCVSNGSGLHVCRKSSKISKNSTSLSQISHEAAERVTLLQNFPNGSSKGEMLCQEVGTNETAIHEALKNGETVQKRFSCTEDSTSVERMECMSSTCTASSLKTIFSPSIESAIHCELSCQDDAETLVHSTLLPCHGADFTFEVFFNMKEHTVYVRNRPFLRTFLERVAEMFEIILFTASQSIYAEQLLDKLDPDNKLFSRRAYRDSCIFSDGNHTKDLIVLGVDLAKVAIVDNSPQVFQLQVDNGIPFKSWFDDPTDSALAT